MGLGWYYISVGGRVDGVGGWGWRGTTLVWVVEWVGLGWYYISVGGRVGGVGGWGWGGTLV